MLVRHATGSVAFEIDDESALARQIREREIRAQFGENFSFLPAEQIDGLVAFEMGGIDASARADTGWCRCEGGTEGCETYYRRPDTGRHGFFHDPALGGCGGITQTG